MFDLIKKSPEIGQVVIVRYYDDADPQDYDEDMPPRPPIGEEPRHTAFAKYLEDDWKFDHTVSATIPVIEAWCPVDVVGLGIVFSCALCERYLNDEAVDLSDDGQKLLVNLTCGSPHPSTPVQARISITFEPGTPVDSTEARKRMAEVKGLPEDVVGKRFADFLLKGKTKW